MNLYGTKRTHTHSQICNLSYIVNHWEEYPSICPEGMPLQSRSIERLVAVFTMSSQQTEYVTGTMNEVRLVPVGDFA